MDDTARKLDLKRKWLVYAIASALYEPGKCPDKREEAEDMVSALEEWLDARDAVTPSDASDKRK